METGIDLIAKERKEQIEKHGRTIEKDVTENDNGQLKYGAVALLNSIEEDFPSEWDSELCKKMMAKTELEKVIIAGALIAAEIDRLKAMEVTNG
jgi:hypothetical protein